MVKIHSKGGVWKNTEDEVLKAAIAKYGKNQWARISSLLVRKTPKQCKARWYEWLDPSIKKTEWSKTEDETLLHLAKVFPTQWRTIVPIVGRTSVQGLERYQKLIDEAEANANQELGDRVPCTDDIRRLRPGRIDPNPESKPAWPDPIDMDEDEKEMLSEARARLANTQGKKAKRKARERQLEEARRLAVLQKKRELKEAGMIVRHTAKRTGVDYNAEIPFEKKPSLGLYDTIGEQTHVATAPVVQTSRQLENKRKQVEDEVEHKKRQRKAVAGKEDVVPPDYQTKFVAARDAHIQKLKEESESIGKRRKLVLSAAQVGEAGLEDIVTIGQAGENAKALVDGGSHDSGRFLCEDQGLKNAYMTRALRATPQHDTVQVMEAPNLRNMIQQTRLFGDANSLRPPMRDTNSAIEPEKVGAPLSDERFCMNSAKRALKAGFMNLPKPANNFELLVPEVEWEDTESRVPLPEKDATERDSRLKRNRELEAQAAPARRTQAKMLGLPPVIVDVDGPIQQLSVGDEQNSALGQAERLINTDLVEFLLDYTVAHPASGPSLPGYTVSTYERQPCNSDMEAAKAAIHQELCLTAGFPNASPEQLRDRLASLAKVEMESTSWVAVLNDPNYDTTSESLVNPADLSSSKGVERFAAILDDSRSMMAQYASEAAKTERTLDVQLGGYLTRSQELVKRITDSFDNLYEIQMEYNSLSRLRIVESAVAPRRLESSKEEVVTLAKRERLLQERYVELDSERREAQARIAQLEEKVMVEAEAYNEARLADVKEV